MQNQNPTCFGSSGADRVRRGLPVALIAAFGLSATAYAAGDDVTPFRVKLPTVTGPIPSSGEMTPPRTW